MFDRQVAEELDKMARLMFESEQYNMSQLLRTGSNTIRRLVAEKNSLELELLKVNKVTTPVPKCIDPENIDPYGPNNHPV